jgi:hypothetical protein
MIDVAVERLVQSEDELRHDAGPPPRVFRFSLGRRDPETTAVPANVQSSSRTNGEFWLRQGNVGIFRRHHAATILGRNAAAWPPGHCLASFRATEPDVTFLARRRGMARRSEQREDDR